MAAPSPAVTASEYDGAIVYHRFMTPNWLRKNAEWLGNEEGNDLNLIIQPASTDWENIFRVELVPADVLDRNADVTVRLKVGVTLKSGQDHMSFFITDRKSVMGMQLLNPATYRTRGPYRAIEGEWDPTILLNINTEVTKMVKSTESNIDPDEVQIILKPKEYFGTIFSSIDGGHKMLAQYADGLDLHQGLWLEMYRFQSTESYTVNYIEAEVLRDS